MDPKECAKPGCLWPALLEAGHARAVAVLAAPFTDTVMWFRRGVQTSSKRRRGKKKNKTQNKSASAENSDKQAAAVDVATLVNEGAVDEVSGQRVLLSAHRSG